MQKTFYIIDDHEMLRVGTAFTLSQNSDWISAGSAESIESALSDLENLCIKGEFPSLVICDLNFQGQNVGFDYMKSLKEAFP